MKSRLPILLLVLLLSVLIGCQDDPYVPRELDNNEFSSVWDGVYVGPATFVDGMGTEIPITATVNIQDVGDNYVRVQLGLFPRQIGYTPQMRQDVPAISLTRAGDQNTIEGTTYYVGLSKAGVGIVGAMWVRGQDDAIAWRLDGLKAVREAR